MKHRFLSIFLLSILAISCFLYVFPLNSLASTILDSYSCWSLNQTGEVPSLNYISFSNSTYAYYYTYDASTGWTQMSDNSPRTMSYQLPSPLSSQQNIQVTCDKNWFNSSSINGVSFIAVDFNLGFSNSIQLLQPHKGDYICLCIGMSLNRAFSDCTFSFGSIVTGNAYEPAYQIDDRFLIYNPRNITGVTTSSIIDDTYWSMPLAGLYNTVLYINFLYDDLINLNLDLLVPVFSLKFPGNSATTTFRVSNPVLACIRPTGELSYLNSIDGHVASIDSAIQSHVAPPSNYTDFSSVDQAEAQVSSKVNTIKNTLDDWALTTYISTGLSWVGAYTSYYFNEFGFIQSIYGIIVFFAIANVLRHGFFRTQRDYVTTDNYSVKGHNTQGDYEITGTRTTRRE